MLRVVISILHVEAYTYEHCKLYNVGVCMYTDFTNEVYPMSGFGKE